MAALSLSGPSTGSSRQTTFSCGSSRSSRSNRHCRRGNRGRHNRRIRPARRRRSRAPAQAPGTGFRSAARLAADDLRAAAASLQAVHSLRQDLAMMQQDIVADHRPRRPTISPRQRSSAPTSAARRARMPPSPARRRRSEPSAAAAVVIMVLLPCAATRRCARPSRCPARAASRRCRPECPIIARSALGSASFGLAFEIVALGGGQRGARLVALAVVDDAELVPGEGIVVVAADRGAEHALGLVEIGRHPRSRSGRGRARRRSAAGRARAATASRSDGERLRGMAALRAGSGP